MVIFHSYVSLPEGIPMISPLVAVYSRDVTHLRTWKVTHLRTWEILSLTHLENHSLAHLGVVGWLGGVGWGGVGWDDNVHVPVHPQAQQPHHLSCCPADTGSDGGVGWGGSRSRSGSRGRCTCRSGVVSSCRSRYKSRSKCRRRSINRCRKK